MRLQPVESGVFHTAGSEPERNILAPVFNSRRPCFDVLREVIAEPLNIEPNGPCFSARISRPYPGVRARMLRACRS